MFEKLLVALDGSFNAEAAANYGINLAETLGARLYIVTVLTKNISERGKSAAQASVSRVYERAIKRGVEAEAIVETGPVVPTIKKFVEKEAVDLAIVASRHRDREKRFFVRTVPQGLMISLPCAVLVIKSARPGVHPKRILVPVVYWKYGFEERMGLIKALAGAFKAPVTVYSVKEISKSEFRDMPLERRKKILKDLRENIQPFIDVLGKEGITAYAKTEIHPIPRRAINILAASRDFDLILIGATQRNIVKRIIWGNPMEEMLRETPTDLIIWYPSKLTSPFEWFWSVY